MASCGGRRRGRVYVFVAKDILWPLVTEDGGGEGLFFPLSDDDDGYCSKDQQDAGGQIDSEGFLENG